jgi:hypothetical protein
MTPPPFGFHLFKLDDKDLTRRLTEISISPMERRLATKKILLVYTMLLLVGAAGIGAEPKPVKLVLSPASTVPRADIMKHIVDKCPNVSFVLDSRKSDFMLEAWGWSGNYKFTVFQKGSQAVYGTSIVLLSNAVKDVCKFVNSQSARD